jgi:hypothetical protein
LVDFFGGGESDSVGEGGLLNGSDKLGSFAGSQLLGVVDSAQGAEKMRMFAGEDDGSDTDRSGKGATSGFV